MSQKHIDARKKYWANMTPEQRTLRMQKIAKAKHDKMTFAQEREHAMKMVRARTKKIPASSRTTTNVSLGVV